MSINAISWAVYAAFVGAVLYFNWNDGVLAFDAPLGAVKLLIWIAYLAFLVYSVYCSARENIFQTIRKIVEFHWGRQIGIDLYLGLSLALFIIYLNEGLVATALWALPTLAFANLSILLYFALHFDAIVAKFAGA